MKTKTPIKQVGSELELTLVEQLNEVRGWTVKQPMTALFITACIAFVLGARWASQWHRDNG